MRYDGRRLATSSPKRMQRAIRRQIDRRGVGTKAQQALKLRQEAMKTERRAVSREERDAEKRRLFEQKQQKRKEKHRGR